MTFVRKQGFKPTIKSETLEMLGSINTILRHGDMDNEICHGEAGGLWDVVLPQNIEELLGGEGDERLSIETNEKGQRSDA